MSSALSVLPLELWLEVFHHATFVPRILEPDIYRQTRYGAYFNNEHHRMIEDALATKRSLVLVCKGWWHLCLPLLYCSILIKDLRSLSALATTLKESHHRATSQPGDEMRSLGYHTARFDFGLTHWRPKTRPSDMRLLEQVLHYLPNLSILSFSVISLEYDNCYMPGYIMDAILSNAMNLRVINWSGQYFYPEREDFERLLTSARNLRVLGAYDLVMSHRILGRAESSPPITPHLTSLSLMGFFREYGYTTYFTFPCLRELACHLWIPSDRTALAQESFFAIHGPQLTALHLQQYCSSPEYATRDLGWIKARCPAVRELTISMRDWKELPVDPVNMPPVEYLGLRCEHEGLSSRHYRVLANFLLVLDEESTRLKSLRVVQFLDPVNVEDMVKGIEGRSRDLMTQIVPRCKFRVIDHAGKHLREYLDAIGTQGKR